MIRVKLRILIDDTIGLIYVCECYHQTEECSMKQELIQHIHTIGNWELNTLTEGLKICDIRRWTDDMIGLTMKDDYEIM